MANEQPHTDEKRKANGYCRYFVRGDCREGNDCKYSHDVSDVPVCRYWVEGRCAFGADCWYKHPDKELGVPILDPTAVILGAGIGCGYGCNFNLLLAAAVASAPSLGDSEEEDEDSDSVEGEELSVDKAVDMWNKRKQRTDITAESPDTDDSNKLEGASAPEIDQDSFESREKDIHNYFSALKKYNTKVWGVEAAYQLITTFIELDIKEYDQYDVQSSRVLGEFFLCWRPDTTKSSELFMKVVEKCDTDVVALILTLCNSPSRIRSLESHIAAILLAAKAKYPSRWSHEAFAAALKTIEYSDLSVDVTRVFWEMGREIADPEQLGKMVREYLVATGEKDSFSCRCKTPECECPVQVDEGLAYMLFENLEKKMGWEKEDKIKFFKNAADTLWTSETLLEIGESLGIKDPLKVAAPRPSSRRSKIRELTEPEQCAGTAENFLIQKQKTSKNLQIKNLCTGEQCSNQAKRDCENEMCKKCCRKSGEPCEIHEDPLDVFEPPSHESDIKFYKIEPKAFFKNKNDLEVLLSSRKQLRRVEFGMDFSIHDEDVISTVDKWKETLVVLELGSSNTGDGVWLTDKAVRYIADNCPMLRKLRLESVTGACDEAVIAIMQKCPLLEHLEVTGHDRSSGALSDKCMKTLFDTDCLPNLKLLCVTDQWTISHEVVYRLRRRRPKLKIIAGETDSDSMAWSMVLGMMGRDYGDGFF